MMKQFGSKITGPDQVTFHVWAPLAVQVDVAGEFNNWQENHSVLTNAGNGYWEGSVNNLREGDKYKYLIHRNSGETTFRIDPATRDTVDSDTNNALNHGIIVETNFNWTPFNTPAFDNLIIYQCHIGSFCGRNDGMHRSNWTSTFQDVISKLDYIRSMGFNTLELLPVQEYRDDRSWGYNPSFYYALESAYGGPGQLRSFVDECHKKGLAVIFDVVYNHISNIDSSFWHFDNGTINSYLSSFETPWGLGPALWQDGIKNFFFSNMRMYFDEYNADGLRFDATRYFEYNRGSGNDGWEFMQYLTFFSKINFPSKYLIAEHVPAHDSIIDSAGFHATWFDQSYENFLNAMKGINTLENIKNTIGLDYGYGSSYQYPWNLIKYLTGSHDKAGDMNGGNDGHRYYVELFGGRENWYARSKVRMAWALNICVMGTPMIFMGNECYMWGYWHDSNDSNGDHRFDWSIAGDNYGMEMRRLVTASNNVRWDHPALRNGSTEITHEDYSNNILAFKRWNNDGDIILIVVNSSDNSFTDHSYGINTKQNGQWQQILCSQDSEFGGWHGAGNAYYNPYNQNDNRIYINIPQWSVLIFKLN
jgi:1,4-alpha-glucan branching enzyme